MTLPMNRLVLATLIAAFLASCSLLTHFDPEDQLCDTRAPADQQCLPGYACGADGRCKKGAPADGGFDAGVDAGP